MKEWHVFCLYKVYHRIALQCKIHSSKILWRIQIHGNTLWFIFLLNKFFTWNLLWGLIYYNVIFFKTILYSRSSTETFYSVMQTLEVRQPVKICLVKETVFEAIWPPTPVYQWYIMTSDAAVFYCHVFIWLGFTVPSM